MTETPLLLRQINPVFVQNGHVIYRAFHPTNADNGMLSVSDGPKISPEAAWRRFTCDFGHRSSGVLGVTHAECAGYDLPVRESPEPDQPDHMIIDFSSKSKGAVKMAAKALCDHALNW